jgi:hypothetical protein
VLYLGCTGHLEALQHNTVKPDCEPTQQDV